VLTPCPWHLCFGRQVLETVCRDGRRQKSVRARGRVPRRVRLPVACQAAAQHAGNAPGDPEHVRRLCRLLQEHGGQCLRREQKVSQLAQEADVVPRVQLRRARLHHAGQAHQGADDVRTVAFLPVAVARPCAA